jgi:hemoglobin
VARPSLYDFAGGDRAFLALAAAFHERCLQDPVLNHPFSHTGDPHHIEHLAAYWAEVFGGPAAYSDAHGGHSGMLDIHAGHGGEDAFEPRFMDCVMKAADDARLPDDPEFREVFRSYMESAVKEVMAVSPPGSTVPSGLPTPHWTWNGPE